MRPAIERSDDIEFDALVVRADFSDDGAWAEVQRLLGLLWDDEFEPSNQFVDDATYAGVSVDELRGLLADGGPAVAFLADAATMSGEHPLLAVLTRRREDYGEDEKDSYEFDYEFGGEFRILPNEVSSLHVNLQLANMDFADFSAVAADDPHRVFRGFE